MKRKLSIFLILVLLTNLIVPLDFSEDKDKIPYNKETNAFDFETNTPTVSTGTAFRTVGFKAYFTQNGQYYEAYFLGKNHKNEEYKDEKGKTWSRNYFHVPLSPDNLIQNEGIPSIYEAFEKTYKESADRVNIAEFFAHDNILKLDAVFAKVKDGVPQGSISIGANGELNTNGTVWKTESEFLGSGIDWNADTLTAVHKDYYGILLSFPEQPVGEPKPIINGTVDSVRAIRDVHTFKEGQNIDLDATDSTFPNKSLPLIYKWKYRKVGTSTWLPVIMSSSGTPFKNSLEVGEYEVELSTAAVCFRSWWNTSVEVPSETPAKTRIVIEKNQAPLATAIVISPPEIMLADAQNSVSIPVTLNTAVLNVEQTDILLIELQLSTYEKNQTKSQFFYPSLNQSMAYSFTIPYNGAPKTQIFEGKAIVTLKGGGMIESPIARSSTYLYKTANNLPPVPVLDMQAESLIGSTRISGGRSYDLDGTIETYDFSIPGIGFNQEDSKSYAYPDFKGTGTFQVILGVTDNDGARSETGGYIKITPPHPSIELSSSGYYKENRKITLRALNFSEYSSPVGENYNWTIMPMDITLSSAYVKMVSTHGKQIDVLMKKKGKYLVTCTGTNTYNLTDTKTMILNISEDLPPSMVVDSTTPQFRDSEQKATITAYDHSYSTDGDFIQNRTWSYRFDSDNDGLFTDETVVNIKATTDYTDNALKFDVTHVGQYEITLAVTESFGQETIPSFITQADYKTGTTKCIVTVDNYKPVVNFMAVNEKKIDIDVMTDYEGQDLLDLESKLNLMVNESYDQFLNIKFNVISDKKYLGRYLHPDATGYTNVMNADTEKYPVANWNGLLEYSDHTYVVSYTTEHLFTNITKTSEGSLPARIIKSYQIRSGAGKLWLLENGDVYFLGTTSANNVGRWGSDRVFALAPIKILSDVKQLVGGDNKYYMLTKRGDVYAIGSTYNYVFGVGSFFTSWENVADYRGIVSVTSDESGEHPYSYGTRNNVTGYYNATKVHGLTGIDYLWSNGVTVAARKNTGKWYGYGLGLNGFGVSTGFVNVPPSSISGAYSHTIQKMYDTKYVFEGSNQIIELTNLSYLDAQIGGIKKIEPNKAYGKDGYLYTFKETPTILEGGETFRNIVDVPAGIEYVIKYSGPGYITVIYPRQVTHSDFTYSKGEKFDYATVGERNAQLSSADANTIKSIGTDITPYLPLLPTPQPVTVRSSSATIADTYDVSSSMWLSDPNSTTFDYLYLYYYKVRTYSGTRVAAEWSEERSGDKDDRDVYGWDYDFNETIGSKGIVGESPYQVGWKTYGIDASKIKTSTYRTGSSKYLLYIAKADSFKKVSQDLEDYIKAHDIAVRVSTKASYVDDPSISATETNLRNLITANPKGKQYSEHAIDAMLEDILAENKIQIAPDGGTYVILGEDTITYDKFYRDLENDPKLSEQSSALHDKDYFENSMGLSAYHNQVLSVPLTTFDKVGKFTITYSATDKPSTNASFMNYNKTSDPATLKVYVHRRPIADFDITYDYKGTDIGITLNDLSYDLDHASMATKGIVKWDWAYKINDETTWHTGKPTTVNYKDTLEIALTVTDLEGATSKIEQKVFIMPDEIPLTFGAELRAENSAYPLTAFEIGNNLEFYDVWSVFNKSHHMEASLWDGTTRVTGIPIKTVNYTPTTATITDGINYSWNNILLNVPNNIGLVAKVYIARIEGISDVDSQKVTVNFPVTIVTNRAPTIAFDYNPKQLYEADETNLTFTVTDPDMDDLTLSVVINYNGSQIYSNSYPMSPSGGTYAPKIIPITNLDGGSYTVSAIVSDGLLSATTTRLFSVISLQITGAITPNPALAGERVQIVCDTKGSGQTVVVNLGSIESGRTLTLSPDRPTATPENTFRGSYIVPLKTKDGTYPVTAAVYRTTATGTRSESTQMFLTIKGNIYQLIKPSIKDTN